MLHASVRLTRVSHHSVPCRPGRSEGGDTLFIRVESGDLNVLGSHWPHALLVAAGRDPFALVEHAVAEAASLSGGAKARTQKLVPASLDSFGWCTWDAFYSRVSARGMPSLFVLPGMAQ